MSTTRGSRLDPAQLARGLAAMLVSIGVLHFVAPAPFDEIIPEEIPGDPRTLTYASGVAEIGLGAALLASPCTPPTSTWSGSGGTSRCRTRSSPSPGCPSSSR